MKIVSKACRNSLLCSEYLLQVINEMLAQLAKRNFEAVVDETNEAQFKLESSPSTTAELADFLAFLDEIQQRVRHTFHIIGSFFRNCQRFSRA